MQSAYQGQTESAAGSLITGELPGNGTYPRMGFVFDPRTAVAVVIGIIPPGPRRKFAKEHRTSYRVKEVFNRPWLCGRVFEVLNLQDQSLYVIVIGWNSALCTCRAGECNRPTCRHRELVRALIAAGAFPVGPATVTTLDECPF